MPGPVAVPRAKAPRLQSLNHPSSVPAYVAKRNRPPVGPTAPTVANKAPKYNCCDKPEVSVDDSTGEAICYECGQEWSNQSQIVAEVTFGENAAGGAVVQGGFVGENQRFAQTMGGTARGLGGIASREQTEWKGKSEIQKLCSVLNIMRVEEQAFSLYKLALAHNFVQGRRVRNVAAICIYLVSRRQPNNTLLLMDLSEKIQVNIWQLGDTYKQFLKTIMMEDPENVQGMITVQQIEPLMLKFCRKLEFEDASFRVAEDACKILRRMKRDWMVQGRQPAGLCGACIILAARMNNFRRTVREVVYVVKVADSTINQRLYEFKQTKSSQLTVEQFREFGQRIKDEILPPSIYRREQREERKRKRDEQTGDEEDVTADDAEVVGESRRTPQKRTSTRKKVKRTDGTAEPVSEPRRDQDGFVIPGRPTDSELMELDEEELDVLAGVVNGDDELEALPVTEKKRRGRPPKKREPIVIPQEDLDIEADLEEEIQESVHVWDQTFKLFKDDEKHPILVAAGAKADAIAREHRPNSNIPTTPDIGEAEFMDDEEVVNCLCTPEEIIIKERIWITENEDWLREQQRKLLASELETIQNKDKTKRPRRRQRQMGDGSLLEGRTVSSPAEAATLMMQERAKGSKFSAHIDYNAVIALVGKKNVETPESSVKGGASPAASSGSGQQKEIAYASPQQAAQPIEIGDDDAEGEDEEDYGGDYDEEGNFIDPGHEEPDEDEYDYDDQY